MNKEKQIKLETARWKTGHLDEFRVRSQEEAGFIKLTVSLSRNRKEHRQSLRLNQKDFAKMIPSSQSRVVKNGIW